MIAHIIACAHSTSGRRPRFSDFLPKKKRMADQTSEEMQMMAKMINRGCGGSEE